MSGFWTFGVEMETNNIKIIEPKKKVSMWKNKNKSNDNTLVVRTDGVHIEIDGENLEIVTRYGPIADMKKRLKLGLDILKKIHTLLCKCPEYQSGSEFAIDESTLKKLKALEQNPLTKVDELKEVGDGYAHTVKAKVKNDKFEGIEYTPQLTMGVPTGQLREFILWGLWGPSHHLFFKGGLEEELKNTAEMLRTKKKMHHEIYYRLLCPLNEEDAFVTLCFLMMRCAQKVWKKGEYYKAKFPVMPRVPINYTWMAICAREDGIDRYVAGTDVLNYARLLERRKETVRCKYRLNMILSSIGKMVRDTTFNSELIDKHLVDRDKMTTGRWKGKKMTENIAVQSFFTLNTGIIKKSVNNMNQHVDLLCSNNMVSDKESDADATGNGTPLGVYVPLDNQCAVFELRLGLSALKQNTCEKVYYDICEMFEKESE